MHALIHQPLRLGRKPYSVSRGESYAAMHKRSSASWCRTLQILLLSYTECYAAIVSSARPLNINLRGQKYFEIKFIFTDN